MDIGKEIKKARGNLTQVEFSKKMNVSRSYLNDLENNRRSPSVETLNKLALAQGKKLEIKFVD